MAKKDQYKCPSCGGTHVWHGGYVPTKAGKKLRLRCFDCGTSFYGKTTPYPKRPKAGKANKGGK